MRRSRLVTAGMVAALAAAILLFGGIFGEDDVAEASVSDARAAAIAGFEELERARVAVDPSRYSVAERSFREALRIGGSDALALRGLGALAAARHRFDESLAYAERARRLDPYSAAVYGLIGDAKLELGRYEGAIEALDRMMALKPTASGYARVSYARELLGDTDGAIEAMRLSVDAAGRPEPTAWALVHLGNLHAGSGALAEGARHYRAALHRVPNYSPALAGLADVAVRRGALRRAGALYRRALLVTPDPGHAVGLGDVLASLGRKAAAERYYRRAHELERRFAQFGGRNQIETALFDLDHDRNLEDALRRAREGARLRPGVEGLHTLAWALYKNGRCSEAAPYSDRALALAPKDTGAIYHRALIERCLGNEAAAKGYVQRVRSIDPTFAEPSAYRLAPRRA